jgi:hypothetical protein
LRNWATLCKTNVVFKTDDFSKIKKKVPYFPKASTIHIIASHPQRDILPA